MNPSGPGNRPPSYSANYPSPGPPVDRTSPHPGHSRTPPTQMAGGPPPINTNAPMGYPPTMAPMGQGPPPPGFGAQTGYPPGGQPPPGGSIAQHFQRTNPAAEVEGASKSKAQLIVGIDFVSAFHASRSHPTFWMLKPVTGHHVFRRRLRLRHE